MPEEKLNSAFELDPVYLRSETEPGFDKAAWKPTWNCFCCHDSGFVKEYLVKTVIKKYDPRTQKLVKCNATNCKYNFGEYLLNSNTLDTRFPSSICNDFDSQERQMWADWSKEKHNLRKQRLALLDNTDCTNNLRARARLSHEHLEAQRRHSDIRIR